MEHLKTSLESINLHKDCGDDTIIVSVDPGVKNTAVLILKICPRSSSAEILWRSMYNLYSTTGVNPDITSSRAMADDIAIACSTYKPDLAIVEYQPPVSKCRNVPIIRYNSWIEGFCCATLDRLNIPVSRVSPSAVKAFFGICESSYHKTKMRVIAIAAELIVPPMRLNDHMADCVLNSIYAIKKTN